MSAAIVELGRHEHDLIGDIIADGFADDPVNLWAYQGTSGMRPVFTLLARHLYLSRGYGHKTSDGSAGALWLPPDSSFDLPLWPSVQVAANLLKHGGLKSVGNILKLDAFMKSRKPKARYHYLFAISVRADRQGQGLGGALMREGLKRADADRLPAYLESSKASNVPFYRAHGFEVIEEVVPTKGCPPMWRMWRDARR